MVFSIISSQCSVEPVELPAVPGSAGLIPPGGASGRTHRGRRVYPPPSGPAPELNRLDESRTLAPCDGAGLHSHRAASSKVVPLMVARPRVVDRLIHPNGLHQVLSQPEVGGKTTNKLLAYIRQLDNANLHHQHLNVICALKQDPLYSVYQELNVAIDTASPFTCIKRLFQCDTGQAVYERPLLQTTIDLCKANPDRTLASLASMKDWPARLPSQGLQTWRSYLYTGLIDDDDDINNKNDNNGIDETPADPADRESASAEQAERANDGCLAGKWSTLKTVIVGGLILITRLGSAAGAPPPLMTRTAVVTASSLLYMLPTMASVVQGRQIIEQPRNITTIVAAVKGWPAEFTVGLDGVSPEGSLTWYKDTQYVNKSSPRITYDETFRDSGRFTLKIDPVIPADQGYYVAAYRFGGISASSRKACLDVHEIPAAQYPIITLSREQYRIMDQVELTCITENISPLPAIELFPFLSEKRSVSHQNKTHHWVIRRFRAATPYLNGNEYFCRQKTETAPDRVSAARLNVTNTLNVTVVALANVELRPYRVGEPIGLICLGNYTEDARFIWKTEPGSDQAFENANVTEASPTFAGINENVLSVTALARLNSTRAVCQIIETQQYNGSSQPFIFHVEEGPDNTPDSMVDYQQINEKLAIQNEMVESILRVLIAKTSITSVLTVVRIVFIGGIFYHIYAQHKQRRRPPPVAL